MDHFTGQETQHPLLVCAARMGDMLKDAAGVDPGFMTADEQRAGLVRFSQLVSQLEALRMRMMHAAKATAADDGFRSVSGWLDRHAHTGGSRQAERLADALAQRWVATGTAVMDGVVSLAQARVIADALDAIEDDVSTEVLGRAEAHLLAEAEHFGPAVLARLGERILEVAAPEQYDELERERLETAQRRASAATRLRLRHRGDGSTDVLARIPDASAARLKTYLEAFTSPRRDHLGAQAGSTVDRSERRDPATGERLPYHRMLGEALCSFLEAADPKRLPIHGGSATSVVVTIRLEDLQSGLGAGTLHSGFDAEGGGGVRISAGQARRLACNARILPAVLGSQSEVLDLGRAVRLFTSAQRTAKAQEQPVCAAEGCDIPWQWCEGHHGRKPWAAGGTTDLADLTFLCPWHHHRAHDPTYRRSVLPNGDVRFHRRQ